MASIARRASFPRAPLVSIAKPKKVWPLAIAWASQVLCFLRSAISRTAYCDVACGRCEGAGEWITVTSRQKRPALWVSMKTS